MARTQLINRRLRSVRNAKQITKAMEVVAASRMRKVSEAVKRAKTYGEIADAIMRRVAPSEEAKQHPYFRETASGNKLYIVFTSDRGLAGAFNANIFHAVLQEFSEDKKNSSKPSVVVFGSKGGRFFARMHEINLIAGYDRVADAPETNIFAPVIDTINTGLGDGSFSSVNLVYTQFLSSLTQKVAVKQLVPIELEAQEQEETHPTVYEFEPSIESVLEEGLRLYFESQLLRGRIESAASEYAMRMIAMGNASRNASDLIDDLTLELNATRQAAITQEIAEITGGATAIAA